LFNFFKVKIGADCARKIIYQVFCDDQDKYYSKDCDRIEVFEKLLIKNAKRRSEILSERETIFSEIKNRLKHTKRSIPYKCPYRKAKEEHFDKYNELLMNTTSKIVIQYKILFGDRRINEYLEYKDQVVSSDFLNFCYHIRDY
jgi:hypothetical protein